MAVLILTGFIIAFTCVLIASLISSHRMDKEEKEDSHSEDKEELDSNQV